VRDDRVRTTNLAKAYKPSCRAALSTRAYASIQTTLNIYTHVVDASHRAAIEQLERQLFPTVPKSEKADNEPEFASVRKMAG